MIGQYVRMVKAPNTRMGTVKAARFDKGQVSFLFQQDPRFAGTFRDVWLVDSEVEECARPTDEQAAAINNIAKEDS